MLFERGDIASNMRSWGHIQLFSPWEYNRTRLGARRLREEGMGGTDIDDARCPTGKELVERYLAPLVELPELRDSFRGHCEVLACGRSALLKKDLGGGLDRSRESFRLLVRDADGQERVEEADIVIDSTGVFGHHNYLGMGGIPAVGELAVQDEIEYFPPDIASEAQRKYAGIHTMVIGAGFSGATTAVALADLKHANPQTKVTWVCRTQAENPLKEIPNDSLPERRRLTETGNQLARHSPQGFDYLGGRTITAIANPNGKFVITLQQQNGTLQSIECDRVVANVGYHPDEKIYRQLHVHECYATLGPIDLAASLMGQDTVDCFAVQAGSMSLLQTPEPDFYILGAKSFGTNPNFLIYLGHEHIAQVFNLITDDDSLNLYAE
ncbi:MAG: hypothetical protein ACI8PT_000993 [Gammaproteobacteria bacterium]|jgi:hypothetical protein